MKQKRLLLVLLVLFAISLSYGYWAYPRQQRASQPSTATRVEKRRPAKKVEAKGPAFADTRLHLQLLKSEPGTFPGYKRNIFGSVEPPPPPPPAPVAKVIPPPVVSPPPPPPPVVAQAQAELAHFDFLGYLESDGNKTVFLSRDKELFLVHQGDRFGDHKEFLATELTPERMVIRTTGDSRPIVVTLVENQALIPVVHMSGKNPSSERPGPQQFAPPRPVVPFAGPSEPAGANAAQPPPDAGPPAAENDLNNDNSLAKPPGEANEVGQ